MSAFLSADTVSYFLRRRPLVDKVSLDIPLGKMTIVIGPNGAGKSTLLRLLAGELRPTAGAVSLEGRNLARIPPWLLACQRVVMTQAIQMSLPFDAHEVVRLGLDGIGGAVAAARRAQIIEQCLAAADALSFASRRYDLLSGGEQKRVQFARALAQIEAGRSFSGRQALLLDEPIANLDLRHQLTLLDAARDAAAQGVAVMAILHDLNLAARYADRLALMSEGALVACAAPAAVLAPDTLSDVFGVDLALTKSDRPLIFPARWG